MKKLKSGVNNLPPRGLRICSSCGFFHCQYVWSERFIIIDGWSGFMLISRENCTRYDGIEPIIIVYMDEGGCL